MTNRAFARLFTVSLLGSASLLGLSTTAQASRVLFSTDASLSGTDLAADRDMTIENGITQVRLDNGAVAAFVDGTHFAIRADGTIDLRAGTVTVVSPSGAPVVVMMPGGVRGTVAGKNASASFTATAKGARGSVIGGQAIIAVNGVTHSFAPASFWGAGAGQAAKRLIANTPATVPGIVAGEGQTAAGDVQPMQDGGIAAAAQNGVPVALGVALAAVGAHGDILEAANRIEAYDRNPSLTAFPTRDYGLLTAYAAQAAAPFGGAAFNGAAADVVRTYFQFLTIGGKPGDFRAAYARSLVVYLDLVRSGALPSGFAGATQAQLSAYIAFIGRTEGFGALSATNRSLLDAYLAFLSSGGTPDGFGVRASSLVGAYLDYLRAGGDPAAFQQASASVIAQYLAILQSGGIKGQLTIANQALLDAYLKSLASSGNGLAFATSAATGLAAFTAFLSTGGFPSQYSAADSASIRAYLETLKATGLFDRVLGAQADFLRSYLLFLQGGNSADAFDRLPINVAAAQANALGSYYVFIQNGGTPSLYGALTQAQINAYLKGLKDSGLFDQLLGANARFLADYYAYLLQGGNPDLYAGLPNVDLNAYAVQVASFVVYLKSGRLPSGYEALSLQQLRDYLNALSASGQLATLLGGDAGFLASYLAYLQGGGLPDQFSGLPINVYAGYGTQLAAFIAYLNAGGLPSGYTLLTAAQIRTYLETLQANGQLAALLGANANFFASYLVYLQGGGSGDTFAGLPIVTYTGYSSQLAAFIAYLNTGGLPSGYTALTAAQIRSYLEALQASGQLTALLGANANFFTTYLAYLQGGGSADGYAGLPIVTYRDYATALNAFYVYLAAGGHPSGYTLLTAAQIRAYLDALNAAGQSNALLGSYASFFAGYLTYLAGGGNGDQYAGLPGVMPPATLLSDANVYKPVAASPNYNIALPSLTGYSAGTVEFTAGLPTKITSTTAGFAGSFARGTAKTVEAGGDQFMSIGRWTDGSVTLLGSPFTLTATQGIAYLVASPDVTIPTSVLIDYSIFAKTSPTRGSATLAPGVFDGKLRVAFNSTASTLSHLQVLGTVAMPDAAGTPVSYGFGTQSAFDNVAASGVAFDVTQPLEFYEPLRLTAGSATNSSCPTGATCSVHFAGAIAGPNAARIGLAYNSRAILNLTPVGETFEGAVIFGANGTFTPGTVTPPTSTSLFSGPVDALWFNNNGVTYSYAGALAAVGSNGVIDSLTQSTAPVPSITRSTASAVENGYATSAAGSVVAWNRWASGTPIETNLQLRPLSATQSTYMTIGSAPTNKPASGIVRYNLLSNIAPTVRNGSAAPGTFNGSMYVNFGNNLIGYDFLINIGGVAYTMRTGPNPTDPTDTTSYFDSTGLIPRTLPMITGGISNGASVTGRFFGNGFTQAGIDYQFGVLAFGPDLVNGSAIFGSGAQTVTSPQAPPAPFVSTYVPPVTATLAAPTGSGLRFGRTGSFSKAVDNVVATADGKLSSYSGTVMRGTATDHENGGLAGVIGWTRWAGGITQGAGDGSTAIPVNGGYGRIWGAPATAVPTTGVATYDLAGATAVTALNGSLTPGVVRTASLGVDFGQRKVGFESTFSVGGVDYGIASRGGVAAPIMVLGINNEFYGVQPSTGNVVNVTGNGCNPGTCPADAAGFLAGTGASHAGITFNFYNPDAAGFAGAAIAFAKH